MRGKKSSDSNNRVAWLRIFLISASTAAVGIGGGWGGGGRATKESEEGHNGNSRERRGGIGGGTDPGKKNYFSSGHFGNSRFGLGFYWLVGWVTRNRGEKAWAAATDEKVVGWKGGHKACG